MKKYIYAPLVHLPVLANIISAMKASRLLIISLILCGANFLQNCQEHIVHVKIIDVKISGVKLYEEGDSLALNKYSCTGDLTSDIVLAIYYDQRYLDYATSLELIEDQEGFDNPDKWIVDEIIEDSYSLSFDTDFVFNGDTIGTDRNLFDSETIVAEMELYRARFGMCGTPADLMINFSDNFVTNSFFSDSHFAVTFSCETTYGLTVVDTTYVAVR